MSGNQTVNDNNKMRLVIHISENLRKRLNALIEKKVNCGEGRRFGMLSFIVESAIKEYLDKVEKES